MRRYVCGSCSYSLQLCNVAAHCLCVVHGNLISCQVLVYYYEIIIIIIIIIILFSCHPVAVVLTEYSKKEIRINIHKHETVQNTVNTSTHTTKTTTHYKLHTYTHPPKQTIHTRSPTRTQPYITNPKHTHTHTLQTPHIHTHSHTLQTHTHILQTNTYTNPHITKQVKTTTVQNTSR
jgi:hypothetical protein